MNNRETTQTTEARQGDPVDIDAIRSGLLVDSATIAALCDELEAARSRLAAADETIEELDVRVSDLATRSTQDRELMRAVLDAIDLPDAATVGDEDEYYPLLERRAMSASAALRNVLDRAYNVPLMTRMLRAQVEDTPVTYKTTGGTR